MKEYISACEVNAMVQTDRPAQPPQRGKMENGIAAAAAPENATISAEEKKRVRIALRIMRKAHVDGSRADKER